MRTIYPLRCPGFVIRQLFGDFFVTSITATALLDVAFSNRLKAVARPDGGYELYGSQRELLEPRLKEIGKFIDMSAPVFPNSIILAANYREEDGVLEDDEQKRWSFVETGDGVATLVIPTAEKLGAVIDGQHRLFGFNFAKKAGRLDMPLLCAIYFDLPKPYQASLFATVNANQRPVSKSQTYELFGFNVEKEPPEKWTPEKFAVFVTRKLNNETGSPFYHRISIPAETDITPTIAEARQAGEWAVSMATVVDGILRLITTKPKDDAYTMDGPTIYEGKDRSVLSRATNAEQTPLRDFFIHKEDELIFRGLKNYLSAVITTFVDGSPEKSSIRKTVGIQALFDLARPLFAESIKKKDFRVETFQTRLAPARAVRFDDPFFQYSGTGRLRIRTVLELCLGFSRMESVRSDSDKALYANVLPIELRTNTAKTR